MSPLYQLFSSTLTRKIVGTLGTIKVLNYPYTQSISVYCYNIMYRHLQIYTVQILESTRLDCSLTDNIEFWVLAIIGVIKHLYSNHYLNPWSNKTVTIELITNNMGGYHHRQKIWLTRPGFVLNALNNLLIQIPNCESVKDVRTSTVQNAWVQPRLNPIYLVSQTLCGVVSHAEKNLKNI